jgi:stress response protein YsnF
VRRKKLSKYFEHEYIICYIEKFVSDKDELIKSKNINLDDTIKKEAIGIDGLDLGKVIEIGETFVVTQRGLIGKKKYHLPISSIETFDGEFLNLKINETDLKSYEQTEGNLFEGYSSFKSSDMSHEVQTTIPLIDEKLEVSKKMIEENMQITKEPIKETKNVEIELSHDKVTIIKRPFKENNVINKDKFRSYKSEINSSDSQINRIEERKDLENYNDITEIIMTLEREEPLIVKSSHVKEEVIVKKESIFETKTITEELIHELVKSDDIELRKVKEENTSN